MLVLSLNAESAYAQRALKLGAAGYLTKDHAADELTVALERIASGRRYISQALAEQLADLSTGERAPQAHEGLSDQEYRVLLQLAGGKRVGEIAETMRLSPKTISTYRSRLLEKLRVKSNAELARYAVSHGLLDEHS
jgi:DNA-binding NarL/FixJ family response regulator